MNSSSLPNNPPKKNAANPNIDVFNLGAYNRNNNDEKNRNDKHKSKSRKHKHKHKHRNRDNSDNDNNHNDQINKMDNNMENNMSHLVSANTTMEWGMLANPDKMKLNDPAIKLKKVDTSKSTLDAIDTDNASDSDNSSRNRRSKDKNKSKHTRRDTDKESKNGNQYGGKGTMVTLMPTDTDASEQNRRSKRRNSLGEITTDTDTEGIAAVGDLFKDGSKFGIQRNKNKEERIKSNKSDRHSSKERRKDKHRHRSHHSSHHSHHKEKSHGRSGRHGKTRSHNSTSSKKRIKEFKTIFHDFEEVNLDDLTEEEIRLLKMEALLQLSDYSHTGIPLTTKYDMGSDLNSMRKELYLIRITRNKTSTLDLWEDMTNTAANSIVLANKYYNPLEVELRGWPKTIKEKRSVFREIYSDMYEKHKDKNGKLSPEFRLAMTLIGSAVDHHTTNSIKNDDNDKEKKKDKQLKDANTKMEIFMEEIKNMRNEMAMMSQYVVHNASQIQRIQTNNGKNNNNPNINNNQNNNRMTYQNNQNNYRNNMPHNQSSASSRLPGMQHSSNSQRRNNQSGRITIGDSSDTDSSDDIRLSLKPNESRILAKSDKNKKNKKSKHRSSSKKHKSSKSEKGILKVKTEKYSDN